MKTPTFNTKRQSHVKFIKGRNEKPFIFLLETWARWGTPVEPPIVRAQVSAKVFRDMYEQFKNIYLHRSPSVNLPFEGTATLHHRALPVTQLEHACWQISGSGARLADHHIRLPIQQHPGVISGQEQVDYVLGYDIGQIDFDWAFSSNNRDRLVMVTHRRSAFKQLAAFHGLIEYHLDEY